MRTVNEYAADVKRHYIEACEAVIGRGGTVESGMPMSDLPLAISNIPHDVTLAYHTAESTTLRTKVPSNVERYARINRIGGMTYKCNNLIPFPYADESITREDASLIVGEDGGITASGTPTEYIAVTLCRLNVNTKSGVYTLSASGTFSGVQVMAALYDADGTSLYSVNVSTSAKLDLTAYPTVAQIGIAVKRAKDGTAMSGTLYPMLNYGETALPYEPYFEGLRNASVTALQSDGVNLFDVSQILNENFVDNGDGTYTFTRNGTSWEGRFSNFATMKIPKNAVITVTCKVIAHSENVMTIGIQFLDGKTPEQEVAISGFAETMRGATMKADCARVRLYINSGLAEGEFITISEPQINYGYVNPLPYKPYIGEIDKVEIPEAVRSLPDYGCGVKGYRNTIEWRENGRCYYVQRVKSIDMGAYNYGYRFSNNRHIFGLSLPDIQGLTSPSVPLNAIATDYNATSVSATWVDRDMAYGSGTIGYQRIEFVDNRYTTVAEFKEGVKGKQLIYALETPIETDITDLMRDNFIAVEGDGTITAVNEYGYDAETSLTYLIETTGG